MWKVQDCEIFGSFGQKDCEIFSAFGKKLQFDGNIDRFRQKDCENFGKESSGYSC